MFPNSGLGSSFLLLPFFSSEYRPTFRSVADIKLGSHGVPRKLRVLTIYACETVVLLTKIFVFCAPMPLRIRGESFKPANGRIRLSRRVEGPRRSGS